MQKQELTSDMKMIAEGLARDLQASEARFRAYIIQCAHALGVNNPKYTFDPAQAAFIKAQVNPLVKKDAGKDKRRK